MSKTDKTVPIRVRLARSHLVRHDHRGGECNIDPERVTGWCWTDLPVTKWRALEVPNTCYRVTAHKEKRGARRRAAMDTKRATWDPDVDVLPYRTRNNPRWMSG